MSQLQLFISNNCPTCRSAREVAIAVDKHYPALAVEIINIDRPRRPVPEAVFAVPTFLLDDRVISLGTPRWEDLVEAIEQAAAGNEQESR